MRCFDDDETNGAGQLIRLQESLDDLQELATKINVGDVQRDDVLWRLKSYFHVVGVVIHEFQGDPSRDQNTQTAVSLLAEIQSLVSDMIVELADEHLEGLEHDDTFEPQVIGERSSSLPSIIPFPSHRGVDSDDTW